MSKHIVAVTKLFIEVVEGYSYIVLETVLWEVHTAVEVLNMGSEK
jgi:hypothetical protein